MDAQVAKDLVEIGRVYTNKKYTCEQLNCGDISKSTILRRIELNIQTPIPDRTIEEEISNAIRLRPFDDLKFFTIKELSTVGSGTRCAGKDELLNSIATKFGINRGINIMEDMINKIKEKGIHVISKYSKQKLSRVFDLDSRMSKNDMIERVKEICGIDGDSIRTDGASSIISSRILQAIESSGTGMWRQFDKKELSKAFGLPVSDSKEKMIQDIYEFHSTPTMLKQLFDDFSVRWEFDDCLYTSLRNSNKSLFKKLFVVQSLSEEDRATQVIKIFKRHLRNEFIDYLSRISNEECSQIEVPNGILFLRRNFDITSLSLKSRRQFITNLIKVLDQHDYSVFEMYLNTINNFSGRLNNKSETIENIDFTQINPDKKFIIDQKKLSVDIVEKLFIDYRFNKRTGPVKRTIKHINLHDFRNNNFNYGDFNKFQYEPTFYKYKINNSKKEYLPQDFIYRLNRRQLEDLCKTFMYPRENDLTMAHLFQWTEKPHNNYKIYQILWGGYLSQEFYDQFMIKYNCSLDAAKFALLTGDLITKDLYNPDQISEERLQDLKKYNYEQIQFVYSNFYHEDTYYSPIEVFAMNSKLPFEDLLLKWYTDKTNDQYLLDLYEIFGLSCPYNIESDSYLTDALKTIKYYTTRNGYPNLDFQFKNDILLDKLYTLSDRELLKIHPVNDHTSRENLIHKIYNLAGKKMIDLVDNPNDSINNLENDIRSLNIFTGTLRVNTPDDPLILYGYLLNRVCMNLDEILASIVFEYTDTSGRKKKSYPLRNPIDPNQFFDRDELMIILDLIKNEYLRTHNGNLFEKYTQLNGIVKNCLSTKIIIQEFIDKYLSMNSSERELCEHMIYLVFILGLYIRYWEGPKFNYPYKFEEVLETQKQSRELKVTVLLCYLKNKLSKSDKVKEYFNTIPFVDYDFTNDRYSLGLQQLSTILELVAQPETFCLAHASDICFETSYFILKNILNKDLTNINRGLEYHHEVLANEILSDNNLKELFMIQNGKLSYTLYPKEILKSSHRDPTNILKKVN